MREIAARPGFAKDAAPGLMAIRLAVALAIIPLISGLAWLAFPGLEGQVLALFGVTLIPISLNSRWIHLGLGQGASPAVARIVGELAMVAAVLALVQGPEDLLRVPVAHFAGELAAAGLLAFGLARIGGGPLMRPSSWRLGLPVLRQAAPLAVHAILGLVMFNADFFFLRGFHGQAAVGYYAAAYSLVGFVLNLGVIYYQSLLPVFAVDRSAERLQRAFRDALVVVAAIGVPIGFGGVALATPIIERFFGAEFGAAALPLAVLIASIPLAVVRNVTQAAQVAGRGEDLVLRSSLAGAICCLSLNALLIPRFGILGAAVATLGTEAIRTAISIWLTPRVDCRIPGIGPWLRPLIAAAVMAVALTWYQPARVELAVLAGVSYYALCLWVLGGTRPLASAIRGSRSTELAR